MKRRLPKGAVGEGVITNFLRDGSVGELELQKAMLTAITTATKAMLHGIALLQSGGCAVLTTPIGDTVAGSLTASFISIRTVAMSRRRS